jgi:hypothetical protein
LRVPVRPVGRDLVLADTFDGDGGDTLNEHEKLVVFDGTVGGERG